MLKYVCAISLPEATSYAAGNSVRRALQQEISDATLEDETVSVVMPSADRLRIEILSENRITAPSLDFFRREARKKLKELLPKEAVTVGEVVLAELVPTPVVAGVAAVAE